MPAGKVQTDTESNSVRLVGKYNDITAIKNVQVAMPFPNSPIYVKDVAEVSDGIKEITSYSRFNGKAGIGLMIKKTRRRQCGRCFCTDKRKVSEY